MTTRASVLHFVAGELVLVSPARDLYWHWTGAVLENGNGQYTSAVRSTSPPLSLIQLQLYTTTQWIKGAARAVSTAHFRCKHLLISIRDISALQCSDRRTSLHVPVVTATNATRNSQTLSYSYKRCATQQATQTRRQYVLAVTAVRYCKCTRCVAAWMVLFSTTASSYHSSIKCT
jgi:hypothetical protein